MILLRPESSRLLTASRNWTLPSPIVILPNISRMTTSPTGRSLISNCIVLMISFAHVMRRLLRRATFGHGHDHAPFGMTFVLDAVHERAHVKDAATCRVEQVVWIKRIRKSRWIETFTVIAYRHAQRVHTDRVADVHAL